jgi:hypothetical protein
VKLLRSGTVGLAERQATIYVEITDATFQAVPAARLDDALICRWEHDEISPDLCPRWTCARLRRPPVARPLLEMAAVSQPVLRRRSRRAGPARVAVARGP